MPVGSVTLVIMDHNNQLTANDELVNACNFIVNVRSNQLVTALTQQCLAGTFLCWLLSR